jgi:type I restriction enzyme M protein
MFEQAFKNIDDALWKEAGCTTELDYTEQTSWLLFLKYLDGWSRTRPTEAALGRQEVRLHPRRALPLGTLGRSQRPRRQLDHNKAITGDDLRDFVDRRLFPYLHGFKRRPAGRTPSNTRSARSSARSRTRSRAATTCARSSITSTSCAFRSQAEKHELSHLYEAKIKNMGNAGRNGGEYYTPRPLIRAMMRVVKPKIGERIYDGACGSAGFLCEAFDYLKARPR